MDKYTKFILTVIAVVLIGIFFKGEKIISPAHASSNHYHYSYQVYGFDSKVRNIVESYCELYGQNIEC